MWRSSPGCIRCGSSAPAAFFAILRVGSNSLQAGAGLSPVVGEIVIATFVILLMVTKVIKFRYPESVDVH